MATGATIGRRIRHMKRYREVTQILVANGFGWMIDEMGLADLLDIPRRWFRSPQAERQALTVPERIRRVVEQLGPTFVKLGQMASVRRDLLPPDLIDELSRLQDDVPPMPLADVRRALEDEFNCELEDIFRELDEKPVGSASIGQVHRAVLRSGEAVAVKVQRIGIERNIRIDLDILLDLARMAERHFDWARYYAVSEMVEEFRVTMMHELDYVREGRNADKLREIHKETSSVRVPEIHWDFTTPHVLVMEYVEGIKLGDRNRLEREGHDVHRIAEQVVEAVLQEMLEEGFFHADPHPGNLAVLPSGQLLLMDFGMVGRLSAELQRSLASLVIALMRRDSDAILRTLYRMGVVPPDVDSMRLRRDVEGLRDKYYDVSFDEISLAQAAADMFQVAYKHKIQIPADLTLTGKALMTLEGVVEHLAPDLRILDIAEPFGKRLLREKLSPRQLTAQTVRSALDAVDLLIDIPRQFRSALSGIQSGKVKLELDLGQSDKLGRQLTHITNRLLLSILLLSLSIFLSGLLVASSIARTQASLWASPFNDIAVGAGAFLVLLLIWSMIRSGRRP